jgi:hypothetical protein
MKIKVEFRSDNIDDKDALNMILKASDYRMALVEIKEHIRGINKHGFLQNKEMNEEQAKVIDYIYQYICDVIYENTNDPEI